MRRKKTKFGKGKGELGREKGAQLGREKGTQLRRRAVGRKKAYS